MRRLRFDALILLVAMLGLAACGDPEPEQRKAFIGFLQTRILDKPGLHVPRLTPDDTKAFGPYAEHYAVIGRFHEAMNASVAPKLTAAIGKGAITQIGELTTRRADLENARAGLTEMRAALDDAVGQADAGRAGLKQPDDLKAVYDKAYERLVSASAATFRDVTPVADSAFARALDVGRYLDAHKTQLQIAGPIITVKDRKIQDELNGKLEGLRSEQKGLQEAQARFNTFLRGN